MKTLALLWAAATAMLGLASHSAFAEAGRDGGPSGAFTYAADAQTSSVQHQVKAVVEQYQAGLNSSDFAKIRPLFAPDAVAEWNNKGTVIGVDAMAQPYATLFKEAKFDTDFQYDAVDLYGDIAIVRTHHPVGQMELSLKDGSKTLDFNREIFVLHQVAGNWKIVLYTFTTQPRQGEQ